VQQLVTLVIRRGTKWISNFESNGRDSVFFVVTGTVSRRSLTFVYQNDEQWNLLEPSSKSGRTPSLEILERKQTDDETWVFSWPSLKGKAKISKENMYRLTDPEKSECPNESRTPCWSALLVYVTNLLFRNQQPRMQSAYKFGTLTAVHLTRNSKRLARQVYFVSWQCEFPHSPFGKEIFDHKSC
jgi:hypothetical protein